MPIPRVLAILAVALALPASALSAAVDIAPSVAVVHFQARVASERGTSLLVWGGPDRFAIAPFTAEEPLETATRDGGRETAAFSGGGAVVRRVFAAAPDGYTILDQIDPSIDTLLARARAGTTALTAGRIGGRATLHGTIRLGPNDCAGVRGGVKAIDLDARTLLPLRVVANRAGARTTSVTLSRLRVNGPLAASALRPRRPSGKVFRDDQGFRRVGPAAAGRNLPYVPRLPSAVPTGFGLALTGWAPRSAITGPEGSIPTRPWLFAAIYARGVERIAITQRRAAGGDWPDDPFGHECQPLTASAVTVGGLPATYALGPETGPHLYWRDGAVLNTVSGPFPSEDLVAIAESLTPLTTP